MGFWIDTVDICAAATWHPGCFFHARTPWARFDYDIEGFATTYRERQMFPCKATGTSASPPSAASALHEHQPKLRICAKRLWTSFPLTVINQHSSLTVTILKHRYVKTSAIGPVPHKTQQNLSRHRNFSLLTSMRGAPKIQHAKPTRQSISAPAPPLEASVGVKSWYPHVAQHNLDPDLR